MGFKLLEAVYRLPKSATSATEQSVLAALAFRANDETKLCFPTQGTLEAMTHFSRSTIALSLNGLREKGILAWEVAVLPTKGANMAKLWPIVTGSTCRMSPTIAARQCPRVGQGSVREPDRAVSESRTV